MQFIKSCKQFLPNFSIFSFQSLVSFRQKDWAYYLPKQEIILFSNSVIDSRILFNIGFICGTLLSSGILSSVAGFNNFLTKSNGVIAIKKYFISTTSKPLASSFAHKDCFVYRLLCSKSMSCALHKAFNAGTDITTKLSLLPPPPLHLRWF